jgi:hypothetical protein
MLSGHGLVNNTTGSFGPALSAYLIFNPSIVRNCGSIDVVFEVVITVPSDDQWSQFSDGSAWLVAVLRDPALANRSRRCAMNASMDCGGWPVMSSTVVVMRS